MMIEKYILYGEGDEVIAIKFKAEELGENTSCTYDGGFVTVGGYTKFYVFMFKIVEDYFRTAIFHTTKTLTQANKIRYTFRLERIQFDKGIKKLKEHNFVVEQVRSHERIMR